MINRKIRISIILVIIGVLSSACSSKKIFVEKGEEFRIVNVADYELENNEYYVKHGASFNKTYLPDGTFSGTADSVNPSRLLWIDEDSSLIPIMYGDELLAFQSDVSELTNIKMERFKDLGYSIGVFQGALDANGYYSFTIKQNTISDSDINKKLKKASSNNIRIATIDDKTLDNYEISAGGVITGLKKNKTYELGIYIGTAYETIQVKADRQFLQSYEMFVIDRAEVTKKNYLKIELDNNYKAGYYLVNGKGLFCYYPFERGAENEEEQNMNEPFYSSSMDQLSLYSQQYLASVPQVTNNVMFLINYETNIYEDEDITCILTSPDGTTYTMDAQGGLATVTIATAIAGKWKINISPKDLVVKNIITEQTNGSAMATIDDYDIVIDSAQQNMSFEVSYTGEGEIWGTVEAEDGSATNFTVDDKNKVLKVVYPYLPQGKYTVRVYHYADTSVVNVVCRVNEDGETIDIITVEE